MLISAVQCESAISIHISPSSWISLPPLPWSHSSRSPQSSEVSSLGYTASHSPSISHVLMCICQCYSPSSVHPPFPHCAQCSFPSLRLYSCPAKRNHLDHLSRFHIHILIYGICFSLSDLLYSTWHHSEVFKYLLIAECSRQMKSYMGTEPWKMTKSFISI